MVGPSRHGWVRSSICANRLGRAIGSGCRGEDTAFVTRHLISASLECSSRSTNLMRTFSDLVVDSYGTEGEHGSCQKGTLGAK